MTGTKAKDDLRVEFLHAVLDKKEQAEREEATQREALEKIEREEEERNAVFHVIRLEAQERGESVKEIKQIDDEQIQQEMHNEQKKQISGQLI